LAFLVVIGDAPAEGAPASAIDSRTPTNFVAAKVNRRWGSEPTIATDLPFVDFDDDSAADLAVGRIPADSPEELAAIVRKILRYERQTQSQPWDRRITAVAGAGGFGPMVDAMIESAGQMILTEAMPAGYQVELTRTKPPARVPMLAAAAAPAAFLQATDHHPPSVRQQFSDGCLAWVYLGHGERTMLDPVAGPKGPMPLLSIDDVPDLQSGGRCPLALLMTCHVGAFDAGPDCLAERLLLSEEGPVAVIAATRVSMPYGNTVFGYEFLRASLTDRPATLGAAFSLAQRRTLSARTDDAMRASLDNIAKSLSPLLHQGKTPWRPEDLAAERREHVAMYHLLGDPLLGWRRPRPMEITTSFENVAGRPLDVEGQAEFDGECLIEIVATASSQKNAGDEKTNLLASVTQPVRRGPWKISLPIPETAAGRYAVRAYLRGESHSAVGGKSLLIPPISP
jgi:hypothetical protein